MSSAAYGMYENRRRSGEVSMAAIAQIIHGQIVFETHPPVAASGRDEINAQRRRVWKKKDEINALGLGNVKPMLDLGRSSN